ncbi:MAG: chemotaxis protein CheW [Verrucomicrobia bacterium]|jgi:purine-binding chemotaxis protein CheW|nr:chemotaxis protein CheW [Verrucomicrobiota bacterium]
MSSELNMPDSVLSGKYLTFALGSESYAIPVLKVREIIRVSHITLVPHMPDYIRGVINLRGKIIPVMDLRLRFGFAATTTEQNCIVVVQIKTSDTQHTSMGMVVDAVEEVAQLATVDVEATPDFGAKLDTDYILGMATIKGVVKALLDIDKIISSGDPSGLTAASLEPAISAH